MTYKQIEASRELRLWISQVIVPTAVASVALLSNAEIRQAASKKVKDAKQYFRSIKGKS